MVSKDENHGHERSLVPWPSVPSAQPDQSDNARERSSKAEPSETQRDKHEYQSLLCQAVAEKAERQQREENLKGYGFEDGPHRDDGEKAPWSQRHYGRGDANYAGRDINYNISGNGEMDLKVRYLSRRDSEQLETRLVPSHSVREVSMLLGREPVVFLRGAIGSGRSTAAIAALLAWARDSGADTGAEKDKNEASENNDEKDERVGLIYGSGSPMQLGAEDLSRGIGYVLDGTNRYWANDLDDHGGHLRDIANKSQCRLVVLVTHSCLYPPRPVVAHRPPSASKVFDSWFENEALAAGLDPSLPKNVRAAIDTSLNGETFLRNAVDIADQVIDLLISGHRPEDIIATFPGNACEHIRTRLDEARPIIGRCFLASAAVLDGMAEPAVSRAALSFAKHIDDIWRVKEEDRPLPTWEQLSTWLNYAEARTDPAGSAGGGRNVRLSRSDARRAVLQVLWEDHPTIREPLIAWLGELAHHKDRNVQIKAAHAAGMLATFDFDAMAEQFLVPWSKSRRLRDHELAAMMLEAAALDQDIVPLVHNRLRQFATGTNTEKLVATHAYGSNIGHDDPPAAMRALRKIALSRNAELTRAAAGTMGFLYSGRTFSLILHELIELVRGASPRGRFTAALAFVRLAMLDGHDPGNPPLWKLRSYQGLREDLAELWRNSLGLRLVIDRAQAPQLVVPESWDVLLEWVNRYNEEQVVRAVIKDVFGDNYPQAERLRKTFLLHLLRWRQRKRISTDLYESLTKIVKGN